MNIVASLDINVAGNWVIAFALATTLVHVILAWGVWGDAHAVVIEKRWLYIVPPWGWALAVLVTGVLGALSYWLINRSTLRPDGQKPDAQNSKS